MLTQILLITHAYCIFFNCQVRPKNRYDSSTVQYTPKIRSGRIRTRPTTTTATPTTTNAPEVDTYIDESYHQISKFNKDFYQEARNPVRVTVSPINEQVTTFDNVHRSILMCFFFLHIEKV